MNVTILAIESSCDDTSVAVLENQRVMSNVLASQSVHEQYGGVVPELASRAHQQNIVPVVHQALEKSGKKLADVDAIAFTLGPGLLGSLLVGVSFGKSLALSLGKPLITIDHMEAHVLAHFIDGQYDQSPELPFLCLTVSGGHTQIVLVDEQKKMKLIGKTLDDAAGETFDKTAKILGLPYPGGPWVDKLAKEGNIHAFKFPKPKVGPFDFSFSGLKTAVLYFLRDEIKKDEDFIDINKNDLCASIQHTIVDILLEKLENAAKETGIKQIGIAGGVSANSYLREMLRKRGQEKNWNVFIPDFSYTTDNAAMIGIAAYFKYLNKDFAEISAVPYARSRMSF